MKGIVAHSLNHVIGLNNCLPWRISADLVSFKKITQEHKNVLFGKKTYDSLGGIKLEGRNVFVLSTTMKPIEGVTIFRSVEEVIEFAAENVLVVAGGEQIYRMFLQYMDEIYITRINLVCLGDTFFPEYEDQFKLAEVIESNSQFEIERWVRC